MIRLLDIDENKLVFKVINHSNLYDALLLFFVPVLLILIYLLPEPVKINFSFSYMKPDLITAFSSHFIHLSAGHLISNIIGYTLLIIILYSLSVLSGYKDWFYITLFTILFVFPFTISAINLAFVRPGISFGLSGIVMSLVGFYPISLLWFLEEKTSSIFSIHQSPILFVSGVCIVSIISIPVSVVTMSVFIVGLITVIFYLFSIPLRRITNVFMKSTVDSSDIGPEFVVITVAFFFLFLFGGFPPQVRNGGVVVNIFSHFIGYCLGFISPYITFSLVEKYESVKCSQSLYQTIR